VEQGKEDDTKATKDEEKVKKEKINGGEEMKKKEEKEKEKGNKIEGKNGNDKKVDEADKEKKDDDGDDDFDDDSAYNTESDEAPDPKIEPLQISRRFLKSELRGDITVIDKMYFYFNNSLRSTQIFQMTKLFRKRLKQLYKMDILQTLLFAISVEISSKTPTYTRQHWESQLYRIRVCSYFMQCFAEELARAAVPVKTSLVSAHHASYCITLLASFSSIFSSLNSLQHTLELFYTLVREKINTQNPTATKDTQLLKYLKMVSQIGPLPDSMEPLDFYKIINEKKMSSFTLPADFLQEEDKPDEQDKEGDKKSTPKKEKTFKGKNNDRKKNTADKRKREEPEKEKERPLFYVDKVKHKKVKVERAKPLFVEDEITF
jgi:hypothetical protein